jgi:beta-N-acetylhexosaminidase
MRNLQSWSPPEGMAQSLQGAGAEFDLVRGWEHSRAILDHIKTNNRQGLAEVYKLALADPVSCGIVRAIRPEDGSIVGTVVLYNATSSLAEFIPALKDEASSDVEVAASGGVSSPVVSPSAGEYATILQSLILLGVKQVKKQGCASCVLDYMDGDGNFDGLSAMGFSTVHTFEEVSCDAATITRAK